MKAHFSVQWIKKKQTHQPKIPTSPLKSKSALITRGSLFIYTLRYSDISTRSSTTASTARNINN